MTLVKKSIDEETHEVEVPVTKKGTIEFATNAAFNSPAPRLLGLIMSVIQDITVGSTGLIVATDIFTAHDKNVIVLCLSIAYVICRAVNKSTGVVQPDK